MRIGIDVRACDNGSGYRGIGVYTTHLVQALMKLNRCHQLIPFGLRVSRHSEFFESPFTPLVDREGFRINGRRSLLNQLDAHGLDLCHVLDFLPPFAEPDRTVVTVYDLIPLVFSRVILRWNKIRTKWTLGIYYRFLKKARQILAISHHTKADLMRLLEIPPERIRVIYPGIAPVFRPLSNPQEITPTLRRYQISTPYALYVGSCDYRKNISGLLRAFARFQARGFGDFHLVLVGKDVKDHRAKISEYASSLGLSDPLQWVGYIPQEDLVALYNGATMLIHPSLYEGFGFTPLEAMACGLPVVTSNNSSLKEVIHGYALQEDPNDEEAFSEAMRQIVLDRTLRETLIQKGLVHAKRFSWDQTAKEVLRVYEEIGA